MATAEDEELPELSVMENFAMVTDGIFRSSFPRTRHIPFLKKLRIKCVAFGSLHNACRRLARVSPQWLLRHGYSARNDSD